MQWLCANDVDVGQSLVYTQWLNEQGGIQADVTVLQLDDSAFDHERLRNLAQGSIVAFTQSAEFDVTVSHRTDLAMVGLMGPALGLFFTALDIPFDDILFYGSLRTA